MSAFRIAARCIHFTRPPSDKMPVQFCSYPCTLVFCLDCTVNYLTIVLLSRREYSIYIVMIMISIGSYEIWRDEALTTKYKSMLEYLFIKMAFSTYFLAAWRNNWGRHCHWNRQPRNNFAMLTAYKTQHFIRLCSSKSWHVMYSIFSLYTIAVAFTFLLYRIARQKFSNNKTCCIMKEFFSSF